MWECRYRVPWLCSGYFLRRLGLRRAARGLRERAHEGAAREIDLEGVVLVASGLAQQHIRRAGERHGVGRLSLQDRFGTRIAPWLVRDATKCEPGFLDRVAIELEPDRDRDQGERIRQPVTNLQVAI